MCSLLEIIFSNLSIIKLFFFFRETTLLHKIKKNLLNKKGTVCQKQSAKWQQLNHQNSVLWVLIGLDQQKKIKQVKQFDPE